MKFELQVKEDLCTGCGNCLIACPINALKFVEISGGKGRVGPELKIEDGIVHLLIEECNGCGTCIRSCSQEALSVKAVEPVYIRKEMAIADLPSQRSEAEPSRKEEGVVEEEVPQMVFEFDPGRLAVLQNASEAFDKPAVRNFIESGKPEKAKLKILEKVKGKEGG
jgi:Fe-S-cluster-containing hydrogenase component 2